MKLAFVLLLLALPLSSAQAPDIGAIIEPVDQLIGDQVPPALGQVYSVLGQNITREDVRLYLDLNFTKVDLGVGGLLIGSGKAELQANVHVRGEMRVISSERIRAAIDGDNAYNITAQNATFLTEVFLPAEVFRATLSAEVVAAFQAEQERALRDYVANAAPELEVLGLDISWDNVSPLDVVGDTSLTEPPLVIELDATLQYVRVESVPSLLRYYFDAQKRPEDPKKAYIESLKEDNSDPLRTRDFFSAAAYDQLLNLSMQPGWSLDVSLAVPRGFSFEYANTAVEREDDRHISFRVDARAADEDVQSVVVASITHRRGVALAMFTVFLAAGALVNLPGRPLYQRFRLRQEPTTDS